MSAPRCTPLQLSALLLLISITTSTMLAQDSEIISYPHENITIVPEASENHVNDFEEIIKNEESAQKDMAFSQQQFDQLITTLEKISNDLHDKDKKTAKKLPKITPALLVTLGIRFPFFIWWCYQWGNFKETVLKENKSMSDTISEVLKLSALTWIITEPFKDHTKPFYEYYRDKFDESVNKFVYTLIGYEENNDVAVAA